MAREKHLTAVHIGNFKRFADFQVENLGQFNLVVGDNNTGKTSFLEALVVDEDGADWISSLSNCISNRTAVNKVKSSFSYLEDNFQLLLNDHTEKKCIALELKTAYQSDRYTLCLFELERDLPKLSGIARERVLLKSSHNGFTFHKNEEVRVILDSEEVTQALLENDFIPFIPFGLGYDSYLEVYFTQNIDNSISKRQKFIEGLKIFIPSIQDVRLGQAGINIFEEGRDFAKPLYTYGEGTTKFFRILCEIAVAQGKRLMIDEIDTGIHHTKFIQFWTTLMQAATEYEVQLFATTHNEECLEYYIEALKLEELAEQRERSRVLRLSTRGERVIPRVYDWEALLVADELNHELRGDWL